jgi:hypothetical protein
MRQAAKRINRGQTARTMSVSSPVGGWNARDPLAEMQSKDAVILDNFFCTPFDIRVRDGYSQWVTGLTGDAETLCSYSPQTGSIQLFAVSGGFVYDVSVAGAVGSPKVSGLTNSRWQHVNFGTAGGSFVVMANGTDLPLVYNGTGWGNTFPAAFNTTVTSITSVGLVATVTTSVPHLLKTGMYVVVAGWTPAGYNGTYQITVTGGSTFTYALAGVLGVTTVVGTVTPQVNFAITGVDPTLFANVAAFKARLWFCEKNSLRVWYLPVLSIGGAAVSIDFSSLFTRGGYLMAMGDWSLDAGYGMDDYAVFITSEGQVAIYKGTDPSSASTWSLIGIYDIGSPIGRRCMMKYAGDMLIVCQDGLAPLSKSLMSSRVNTQEMLTDKIQHVMSDYVTNYGTNFGWETTIFPKENMLFVNVPVSSTISYQLVMNTISGAWSRFLNWNAHTFELHGDHIYFGGSGKIYKAWDTTMDNGNNITFEGLQSFNYFGSPGQLKQVTMIRPVVSYLGSPSILLGANADFDTTAPTGQIFVTGIPGGVWDSALWDQGVWGSDTFTINRNWQTTYTLGYCVAGHMIGFVKNASLRWASTDFLLKPGGVL